MPLRLAARTLLAATTVIALAAGGWAAAATPGGSPATARGAATARAVPTPGSGWFLTVVEHGRRNRYGELEARRQRLELVSPAGERTGVYARDLGPHGRGAFLIADWSADGRTALLVTNPGLKSQHALVVDVGTRVVRNVSLGDSVASALLDGDGGLLLTGYSKGGDRGAPLWRLPQDGQRTRLAARVDGPVLPSPDHLSLVTGTTSWRGHGLRVLDRNGELQKRIATGAHCTPVRWWDTSTVEVQCAHRSTLTLSLVDLTTGSVTALTRPHGRDSADLGDLDARRVASGLYLQASGPCGYLFLARQRDDGSVAEVRVPHAVGNVLLIGAEDDRLVIEHAASCDGATPRAVLARFDPASHEEQPIVRLGRHADFGRVLAYGERPASSY
ncbi:hypothetical protein [Nocardioides panaciterrulae]|uniref:TolB protein n=1 Tax=Nocardioides panaciterrulae TaxID=661492 RepID=A0A7Y9JB97_9ACTN|nr:hypothetical protein [Nocardioides panaciterrulae]NYD42730.1 TolB protein [Nocardioides panaciterrulae]